MNLDGRVARDGLVDIESHSLHGGNRGVLVQPVRCAVGAVLVLVPCYNSG